MGELFEPIADGRQQSKVRYSVADCLLSGLGMMYFQEPSLLSFQQHMEDAIGNNNLRTLFGVNAIPSDSQMRTVLDELDPEGIRPIFAEFFRRLQRSKILEDYRFLDGLYIVASRCVRLFWIGQGPLRGMSAPEAKRGWRELQPSDSAGDAGEAREGGGDSVRARGDP